MSDHNYSLGLSSTDLASATITSGVIDLENCTGYAVHLVFIGSPVGTFKLQGSNDQPPTGTGAAVSITNWSDIAGSSVAVAAAGDTLLDVTSASYRWARVYYTKTSGTGTITVARANLKVRGRT